MNRLTAEITDIKELYKCYMPFVKGGGLFIKTSRQLKLGEEVIVGLTLPDALEPEMFNSEVIWVTPQNSQHGHIPGVGVWLDNAELKLQLKIEKLLGPVLNSAEKTYTM